MRAAMTIDRTLIEAAAGRIGSHVRRTPLMRLEAPACEVKLEQLQVSGSFKARGAFNNLLSRTVPEAGVAAASGGNHGAAVANAAARLGHKCRIFVPRIASPAKLAAIRAAGAEVVVEGERYADALALCDAYQQETGAIGVHAYDAAETIAGQGTLAKEWEEHGAGLDTVLVAVGGGGLIAGIAAWFERRVKVVAVEPDASCCLAAALDAGRPVDVEVGSVAADSLGARRIGSLNFAILQAHLGDNVRVSDDAIVEAQRQLWRSSRIVTEPGGAAAYAALSSGAYRPRAGERIGVLVCGANVDLASFPKALD